MNRFFKFVQAALVVILFFRSVQGQDLGPFQGLVNDFDKYEIKDSTKYTFEGVDNRRFIELPHGAQPLMVEYLSNGKVKSIGECLLLMYTDSHYVENESFELMLTVHQRPSFMYHGRYCEHIEGDCYNCGWFVYRFDYEMNKRCGERIKPALVNPNFIEPSIQQNVPQDGYFISE